MLIGFSDLPLYLGTPSFFCLYLFIYLSSCLNQIVHEGRWQTVLFCCITVDAGDSSRSR